MDLASNYCACCAVGVPATQGPEADTKNEATRTNTKNRRAIPHEDTLVSLVFWPSVAVTFRCSD